MTTTVKPLRSRPRPRSRAQRGAVLVELSLVLPILLLLTLATVEFAQAMAAYKVVVLQVRVATRYLSTKAPGSGHAEARCLLTHGVASAGGNCTGTALMPGLVASGFGITVADALNAPATQRAQRTSSDSTVASATTINLVTVSATGYRYRLNFAAFLSSVVGGAATFDFAPISMTMRQTQ